MGQAGHHLGLGETIGATYRVVLANAVLHYDASQVFLRRGDTNYVKMAPAINKEGRKKIAPLPPEATTPYASEEVSLFSCSNNELQHLATVILAEKRR